MSDNKGEFMLTTVDNPFDPFEQFTSWFLFDIEKGYNTCSLLGKILSKNGVSAFGNLSQKELDEAADNAIEEIIEHDFLNIYKRVFKQTHNPT